MDDPTVDKIFTEVSNFYRTITTPFLNRMPETERENAILWGQKVMGMKNYDSKMKYLTFLTFMIINGHLVSPFDSDAHNSQIPPLPVHIGECKMLEYIEKVVGQCRMPQTQNDSAQTPTTSGEMTAVLSKDEMAFLSTQPTPGVGIRLYLATSAQPFTMWSKVDNGPNIVKYNVPAKDVVDRGLSLAKEKFYSYLDELEKRNKAREERQRQTKQENGSEYGTDTDINKSNQDQSRSTQPNNNQELPKCPLHSQNDTNTSDSMDITSSSIGLRSGIPRPRPKTIPANDQQNETTDITSSSLGLDNDVSRNVNDTEHVCDNPRNNVIKTPRSMEHTAPANVQEQSLIEQERQNEKKLQERVQRWFSHSIYDPYRDEIRRLMKLGTSVDTIRRSLHATIRQSYRNINDIPLLLQDSLDESVPSETRMDHFRKRYMDVLKNEYGITKEGELYYLLGIVTLGDDHMKRARELIKRAEEGLVDPSLKEKFKSSQLRTCGRLMSLIEELLESTEQSSIATNTSNMSHSSSCPLHRRRRLAGMPPTSELHENSDYYADNSLSDQSSSGHSTTNQSNQSFDIRREQPPPHFYSSPETTQEQPPNGYPGQVHSYCPKENC